jgi:NAD+ kinase
MAEAVRSVVVMTHEVPSVAEDALAEVISLLEARGIRLLLPSGEWEKHARALAGHRAECCELTGEELSRAGLCLVLGGDGTMLRALRFTRYRGVPVAGVALGRVSYFATIRRDRITADLGRVLAGDYLAHPMVGLAGQLGDRALSAVNDVVVGRARHSGICRLSYALNGVTLFDVGCDSLIVSTPAGSSAYNLSAGGPLLGFGVEGYVLTFVAPHTLGARSVVAAGSDVLAVTNRSGYEDVEVAADGELAGTLEVGATLELRTAPAAAFLALLPEQSLYNHFQERFS